MVGNSPRRGELRLQSYGLRTSLSPSQLARPWQMNLGFKGWGQFARTALHLKTPQRRPQKPSTFHDQPPYPVPPPNFKSSTAMGKGRKRQVEDVTGSRSLEPACRRLRAQYFLCYGRSVVASGGDDNARQHPE